MGTNRRRRRKQRRNRMIAVVIIIIAVVFVIGSVAAKKYTPSRDMADLTEYYGFSSENSMAVIFNNEQDEYNGIYENNRAYINYQTVRDKINRRFFWDDTENLVRYVTPEGVVSATVGTGEYSIGKEKQNEDYDIVKMDGDQVYLALDFIVKYTDLRYEFYEEPNRVVISDQWGEIAYNELKRSAQVRVKGGIKSDILVNADKGTYVTVLEEGDKWDKVCTMDGYVGYVKKKSIGNVKKESYLSDFTASEMVHTIKDYKICMAWHQVTSQAANNAVEEVLRTTSGINVISPTWFYLNDNEGGIYSLADQDYVTYCHQNGVEVWALVSNLEDDSVDVPAVLNQTFNRDNLVNQLIAAAIQYDLDGINVDFEALSSEAGDGYIQFIRELSLKCANNGIVLSVDNYVPSEYTALYDREEQAAFADYIVLMAYDEHYSGSQEAGSVASLDFVEKGVTDTLKEVPAEQLILGIPFYTREWSITTEFGQETVTSEAIGMEEAAKRVSESGAQTQWLQSEGQNYAEYTKDGALCKIWLEDEASIDAKLQVLQANELAGAAFWKLGFEGDSIWDTIVKYLN